MSIIPWIASTVPPPEVSSLQSQMPTKDTSISALESGLMTGVKSTSAPRKSYFSPAFGFSMICNAIGKVGKGVCHCIRDSGIGEILCSGFAVVIYLIGGILTNGVIALLIGNGILRAADSKGYADNTSVAAIGAIGTTPGLIFMVLVVSIKGCVDSEKEFDLTGSLFSQFIFLSDMVLLMTVTGTVGAAFQIEAREPAPPSIDITHATRAGALGGFIWGTVLITLAVIYGLWDAMYCRRAQVKQHEVTTVASRAVDEPPKYSVS